MAKRKKFKRTELKKQMTKEERALYNEVIEMQREANQRLNETQRIFGVNTWASKKLQERLSIDNIDVWSEFNNKVTVGYIKDITKLKAIKKALNNFLASETSTVKGIKNVIRKQKKVLGDIELDEDDLESNMTMYDYMSDDAFRDLSRYIPASELVAFLEYARESNLSESKFLDEVENYISFGNDEDMKERLINLYNKYGK